MMSNRRPKEDPKALALKENLLNLRANFIKLCDLFEKVVEFNHNPTSESAKRKLDLEIEKLKGLKDQYENKLPPTQPLSSDENLSDIPEYDKYYVIQVNGIVTEINTLRNELITHIQDKTEVEENVAKEIVKLRLGLQREQAESMHNRQSHDYAVTEKNTVLATCRKLEEQLEDRSKQIHQLQREGTVSLWKREKAKIIQEINSNEEQLNKQVKELREQNEDTKTRLNRRVQELTDQIKLLKMEKDFKNGSSIRNHGGGNVSQSEMEKMRQQLFMKDRILCVAEGELQKQQKYYVGFLSGLSRDFRVMLERQHLTVKDYNKDQKTFASMLNKMYGAVKEGTLADFRATLPSHYLGLNVELSGHPLGKKISRPFMDLEKHLEEIENSEGIRYDFDHPLLTGWREGKNGSDFGPRKKSRSAQITGVHPQLVDMTTNTPLFKEAAEHFPEWSAKEIEGMYKQFKACDDNDDFHLDNKELLRAIPDVLGRLATTEEIKEALLEVDVDSSGTVDFFEFLCVARLITQGKGEARLFKKKTLTALRKKSAFDQHSEGSRLCVVQ